MPWSSCEQRPEQVRGLDRRVALAQRAPGRGRVGLLALGGQLVGVHRQLSQSRRCAGRSGRAARRTCQSRVSGRGAGWSGRQTTRARTPVARPKAVQLGLQLARPAACSAATWFSSSRTWLDAREADALAWTAADDLAQQHDVARASSGGRRPAVRPGETRPSRSYWRRVCGCSPESCGGHRDDEDRCVVVSSSQAPSRPAVNVISGPLRRRAGRPAGPRPRSPSRTPRAPRAPCRVSFAGTATSTVTSRSPRVPSLRGHALAADPEGAAVGRARRELQRDRRPAERRHLDLAAERRLGERDRHGDREVVALAAEHRVRRRRATTT